VGNLFNATAKDSKMKTESNKENRKVGNEKFGQSMKSAEKVLAAFSCLPAFLIHFLSAPLRLRGKNLTLNHQ
jgi:hypothetical protein